VFLFIIGLIFCVFLGVSLGRHRVVCFC